MPPNLLPDAEAWLNRTNSIQSAVLFGSMARQSEAAIPDSWSDLDFHVITTESKVLESVDWSAEMPSSDFRFQVVRPATGGVRKATVFFDHGQIDLVIVPASRLRLARWGLTLGLQHRNRALQVGLNEVSTCLRSGYRFIKGQGKWGAFYDRVAREMPGVRLGNQEAGERANVAVADLLWVLQKLQRGEWSAAQHLLHRSMVETNLMLLREVRLRKDLSLPSFGLGRHAEKYLSGPELDTLRANARVNGVELQLAAQKVFAGLRELMAEIDPSWSVPRGMTELIARAQPPAGKSAPETTGA